MKRLHTVLLALALLVCTAVAQAQPPKTVLVVGNAHSSNSLKLVEYYRAARGIPQSNTLLLDWDASDNADSCSLAQYTATIAAPIYTKIAQLERIDYIVLCRNLPVKITSTGGSVDSALAAHSTTKQVNPYRFRMTAFSSITYGIHLVTRLDGWSWRDAFALVERSLQARAGAPLFFDIDSSKGYSGGYGYYNALMQSASVLMTSSRVPTVLDNTAMFVCPSQPVGGYFSWGSNDSRFNNQVYNALKFAPGAIAETLVSTSASNLRFPGGGQSQIASLIANGVTGVKGYVTEPLLSATAEPRYLFMSYTSGRNLAEAFYAASSFIGWKDVIVGDPLCSPYQH